MKNYTTIGLSALLFALACPMVATAETTQETATKAYMVKGDKLLGAFDAEEGAYLTFDLPGDVIGGRYKVMLEELNYRVVDWKVFPENPNTYYYSLIYEWEALPEFGDVNELGARFYNDMRQIASLASMPVEQFMEENVVRKGDQMFGDAQLAPGRKYAIVTFGIEPDGTITSDEYSLFSFMTPEVEMLDFSAEFDVQLWGVDATVTVTPNNDDIAYYVEIDEWNRHSDNPQAWLNTLIWRGDINGKSPLEVVQEITKKGPQVIEKALMANSDYTVWAVSVTDDGVLTAGVVNSPVSKYQFQTGDVMASSNDFVIELIDITPRTCKAKIQPSIDEESYSFCVIPVSALDTEDGDTRSLEDYLQEFNTTFLGQAQMGFNYGFGTREVEWVDLEPETDYYFCVFGYYQKEMTTAVTAFEFTTAPPSDPTTWTGTFENVEVWNDGWSYRAKATLIGEPADVKYVALVTEAQTSAERVKELFKGEWDRYQGYGLNYAETRSMYGTNVVDYSGMQEDIQYKFAAGVMSAEDGSIISDVFFSDPFDIYGVIIPEENERPAAEKPVTNGTIFSDALIPSLRNK